MHHYYRWIQFCTDDPKDRRWHIKFPTFCWTRWWLETGEKINDWDTQLSAVCTAYGTPTDFPLTLNDWPVHSKRLKRLLEREVPKRIQYLPFKLLVADTSTEISGYWVANYLGLVDCLNRRKTTVRNDWKPVNNGGDFGVMNEVLSRGLIGEERLFRILGDRRCVVVRDDLKEKIENAGCTGSVFKKLDITV